MTSHPSAVRRVAALAALLGVLAFTTPADASTVVTAQWTAKIGTNGADGSATLKVLSTGSSTIAIVLKSLAHSTIYTATILRGTCAHPSTKVLALTSLKTTSTGTFSRTSSVTSTNTKLLGKTGQIIRFVTGTHAYCGPFVKVALAPPPPPPPAVSANITVGSDPFGVAFGPTGVLVANFGEGNISRVDPTTNSVLSAIPLTITGAEGPVEVAYDQGGIWVTMAAFDTTTFDSIAGSVERLDPVSGQLVANIPVGKSPQAIATSPGAIWVANYVDGTVSRIDPTTNTVVATITVDPEPNGIAFGAGAVWVTSEKTGNVSRIDPATNIVAATVQTLGTSEGVTFAAGAIWVAYYGHSGQADGALSRIDPTTNQVVRTIVVGFNPDVVTFGGTSIWVAMRGEPTVVQVNPITNTIEARVTVGPPIVDPTSKLLVGLQGIVADSHNVWAVQPLPAPDATSEIPPGKLIRISY